MRIAVFGSLTEDLFVEPEGTSVVATQTATSLEKHIILPYGAKLLAQYLETHYGGGASNVSVALSRLGHETCVFGAIGKDERGDRILTNFKQNGVLTNGVLRTKNAQSGSALIITVFDGERTVVFSPEANRHFTEFSLSALTDFSPEGVHACHFSAASDSNLRIQLQEYLVSHPDVLFSWNPGKTDILLGVSSHKKLLERCSFLFLNAEEAESFSNKKRKSGVPFDDFTEIANVFLSSGVRHVIITDGQKGAHVYSHHADETFFISPVDSPRLSTLGAGDGFASGFLGGFLLRKNLQFAGKCASMLAASVVSKRGAQEGLLSQNELFEKK